MALYIAALTPPSYAETSQAQSPTTAVTNGVRSNASVRDDKFATRAKIRDAGANGATNSTNSETGGGGGVVVRDGDVHIGGGKNGKKHEGRVGDKKESPSDVSKAKRVTRGSDCPCGSGLKYKKCCRKKDAAISRGQALGPAGGEGATADRAVDDPGHLADDLGSVVI